MNATRNKVQLIGHVGKDPEMVNLESGRKLVTFSLATDDFYKNAQGEWVDHTNWHRIVTWGKTAEMVERLISKGKEVQIEGKLKSRSYEAKDGSKRYITEVECNELFLIEKPAAPVS